MLHAYLLGFTHPETGERLEFISPLPAEFERVLKRLREGR
jgi:23S rRNA pseudouridine1911/1915/1917 synthase